MLPAPSVASSCFSAFFFLLLFSFFGPVPLECLRFLFFFFSPDASALPSCAGGLFVTVWTGSFSSVCSSLGLTPKSPGGASGTGSPAASLTSSGGLTTELGAEPELPMALRAGEVSNPAGLASARSFFNKGIASSVKSSMAPHAVLNNCTTVSSWFRKNPPARKMFWIRHRVRHPGQMFGLPCQK